MAKAQKQISETVVWDKEFPGLGLRSRDGRKTWIVQTRVNGKTRKRTLGSATEISRSQARLLARKAVDNLSCGTSQPDTKLTVGALAERFLRDGAARWKPGTQDSHGNDVYYWIKPRLGAMRVMDITRAEVLTFRDALPIGNGSMNRATAVLSGIMRHAELLDLRRAGSNPCKGLRRRSTGFKATYLTHAEFKVLGRALRDVREAHPEAAALIRFVALSGCRKGEAQSLRWDWYDGGRVALPEAKSGPRSIWLGKAARDLLDEIPRGSDFIFQRRGQPLGESYLNNVWYAVRADANLSGVRLHDLRHSFASQAISGGMSLRTIAGLLGHRDLNTTAGYAHLQTDALKAAAQRTGSHMTKLLNVRSKPTSPPARQRPRPCDALRRQADDNKGMKAVKAYLKTKAKLSDYCAEQGVDQKWLTKELVAFRKERAQGRKAVS